MEEELEKYGISMEIPRTLVSILQMVKEPLEEKKTRSTFAATGILW